MEVLYGKIKGVDARADRAARDVLAGQAAVADQVCRAGEAGNAAADDVGLCFFDIECGCHDQWLRVWGESARRDVAV